MSRRMFLLALVLALPLAGAPSSATPGAVWLPTLPTNENFQRLSIFANGVAYAQVDGSYAVSTDYGVTWRPRPQPGSSLIVTSSTVNGVATIVRFATPLVGYALATSNSFSAPVCGATQFLRTTDGGLTWAPVCLPAPAVSPRTWAVSPLAVGTDADTVVLTALEHNGPPSGCENLVGVAYVSTDGGASWTRRLLLPNSFPAWTVDVLDANHMALVAYHRSNLTSCDARSDTNAVQVTSDGGATWTTVLECGGTGPLCTSTGMASTSRILIGLANGSTRYSNDGGLTVQEGQELTDLRTETVVDRDPGVANLFWVQSFAFVDQNVGYASTRGGGLWRTNDGGLTWRQEATLECGYFPLGVGEVAATVGGHALAGSHPAVSTRIPAFGGSRECTPVVGWVGTDPGPVVDDPNATVDADASVEFHVAGFHYES